MSGLTNAQSNAGQPSLAELTARFLQKQTAAHTDGVAVGLVEGEVVPFEAAPVQPVDGRIAWEHSLAVLPFFQNTKANKDLSPPPLWNQLVMAHEPVVALAFCIGNFPQMVRNLQPLVRNVHLSDFLNTSSRPISAPALVDWAAQIAKEKKFLRILLAVGTLRLAKLFEAAADLVAKQESNVPADLRAAWDNEKASLAWHRGNHQEAFTLWQSLPDSVPVLFNRGMAALFLDQPALAIDCLEAAIKQLPEASAWHHLAWVYLTLAKNH